MGIAEASDFYKWNSGSSLVSFTFYAVILQRLIATRKLMTLPGAVLAWFLIGWIPKKGVTGAKNATAHHLHWRWDSRTCSDPSGSSKQPLFGVFHSVLLGTTV